MRANNQADNKKIFVEDFPYIGEVPMMFYFPPGKKELNEIKPIIEAHGGKITEFHECFTYQL